LYAIRDVTATVPSNALIVSSILSKKAIEDLDALVLDVKYGSSAFMKTPEQAEVLADWLKKVSEMLGMRTCCYITEMNNPIGYCIGNAIEIQESLDLLKYAPGHSADLENLICEQGQSKDREKQRVICRRSRWSITLVDESRGDD
jgi:thymidine phosphorylase